MADSATESPFAWKTPKGWTELAPTALRSPNFRPAGDTRAECYSTLLAGNAGGLAANVHRWQAQLGLPALEVDALAALEKRSFLGREATFVDIEGTWSGMSGAEARPGWRLVGLLLVEPEGSVFLKMTGPADVLARELAAFHELAGSFRARGAPLADAREDVVTADTVSGFTFTTPTGWSRAPDRPARVFSLYAGPGNDVQCYVTTLPGDAGGALANVNHWRGQLGLDGLGESDVARLPRIDFLRGAGTLVECDGAEASLLAALGTTPTRSIFVKMTGPRAWIQAQRAAFLAFCASLREAD